MTDPSDPLVDLAVGRVGARLRDKYTLERLLGVGGMSAVYQAVHRNGNRVAVKMLHPTLSANRDVQRRFLREGYAANNVDHPGVVRVLDDDVAEDGSTFVVMELLNGETLAQRADRHGGTLPPEDVLAFAYQLLDVLAAAKDKGIVHRDIKPDNMFVTADGTLKLLDFGVARVAAASSASHATLDGAVFGTPAFMPPEQALGETDQVDHQSDLWAVGATMFTLLTGALVHDAANQQQLLVYTASRHARSIATVDPGLPAAIVEIVDRALRYEKKDRWPSAREMQDAVERALVTLYRVQLPSRRGARFEPPSPVASTPSPAVASTISPAATIVIPPSDASLAPTLHAGRGRRAVLIAAVVGGMALLGVVLAVGVLGRSAPSPAPTEPTGTSTAAPLATITVAPGVANSTPPIAAPAAVVSADPAVSASPPTATVQEPPAPTTSSTARPVGSARRPPPRPKSTNPFDHQ